ncbi:hypothetical protein [Nocardioides plantarum]|uniref:ApeA N-terminal domain-containing protein n=1 Tax=Nocardioides plantarum TaxID=29299 RepID=A0ABV5K821_9ACTN|nr:hypothetical protein [Nocardioides plantarum]
MGLFDAAHLITRQQSDGTVLVRAKESYSRSRPDLLTLVRALGPTAPRGAASSLSTMSVDSIDADVLDRSQVARDEELRRIDAEGGSLASFAAFHQLASMGTTMSHFPAQAEATWQQIREMPAAEDGETPFPHAGVYAIRRDDALLHRIKIVSVMLRIQHDPQLAAGDLSGVLGQHTDSARGAFASAAGLHSGYYMLDAYIGPLLGALSPGVWGFAAHRGRGPIIYSFGRPVSGTTPTAPDLLRTISTPGAHSATEFSDLPASAVPSALSWWSSRLNELFSVVSDPAVFADNAGDHQAAAQLEAILSVEQLFRRVTSIQVNYHDLNARQVLLFSVLDTVEKLAGRSIETNCSSVFARKRLQSLEDRIPDEAKPILLPRARRAVEALEELQRGFFILEPDGRVLVEPSTGRAETPSAAAAQYLKMLRNATHGHGPTRGSIELSRTLLARHDGLVPHDVALLAWLYMLDLLAQPDVLRRRLSADASRPPRGI